MRISHSEFLEAFPIPLHHRQPGKKLWVFWSQYEGRQNNTSVGEKIKLAFSNIELDWWFLVQLWAPVTIGNRHHHVLSTSGQPFAVSNLSDVFTQYRLYSEKYHYIINENNKLELEPDHMILSGGPASAFLNRLPYFDHIHWIPLESHDDGCLNFSIMLPIRFHSQSECIGVLEFAVDFWPYYFMNFLSNMIMTLKEAGLDVFYAANLLPYKTLHNLKPVKDNIKEALKIVCGTHNLELAQVWVTFEGKNHASSMEDARTKRSIIALKLTGYLYVNYDDYEKYYKLCDAIPHGIGKDVVPKTLQDYKSRYISNLCSDMIIDWDGEHLYDTSALVICLRSSDTGDFNFAFEFLWFKRTNYVILLEALLLTIKRCLPSFKFACGAELGDELDVINESAVSEKIKIFQGKRSSPTPKSSEEAGKKSMVVGCKSTHKILPLEVIEKQFGKTMIEAAKNLDVSKSTLKRKLRKLGIMEWPGTTSKKKNTNDPSIIEINTYNREIQMPTTIGINKNILTIKADYADQMIKFQLPVLQATFVNVEKEIGMKFNLCLGTYKLKYHDEVGDWILLTSNEEMNYCIESWRKLDLNEVRLRVLPSTQAIFRTSCSYGT